MPFQKGVVSNPYGRPRKPEIELFRQAILQVEKKKNKSLLVHAVERAFIEDDVLNALLKKILPDKIDLNDSGRQKGNDEIEQKVNARIAEIIKIAYDRNARTA